MKKLEEGLSVKSLHAVAKQTGFSKLERQSLTPEMFLKMVLFDHLLSDQPSLQQHSYSILEENGVRISKQGIDKRFNEKAVAFVKTVFEDYLREGLSYKSLPSHLQELFTSILLMDSTEFKLPECLSAAFPGFKGDGTASCAQVQFEFDVLSGRVRELTLENATSSDLAYAHQRLPTLQRGALLLRDMAYYSLDMFKEIEDRGCWYISRVKPHLLMYEKKGEKYRELTHAAIIKRIKQSGCCYVDIEVYLGKEKKYRSRLIANLLDEASVAKREKRKKHRKSEALTKKDKQYCQLNLFVTNISQEAVCADDIYRLYKIRWQVELIFKIWKSVLKINEVRKMKAARLRCYLYSKFLWILLCWDICHCYSALIWKKHQRQISLYKCYALLKRQAHKVRCILLHKKNRMEQWLKEMYQVIIDYGLKENKKGRLSLTDLLKIQMDF